MIDSRLRGYYRIDPNTAISMIIDDFFATLAVGTDALSRRYSWRLGRSLGHGLAAVQELTLKAYRWSSLSNVSETRVRAAQNIAPKALPRFPSPFLSSGRVPRRAESLKDGLCQLESGKMIRAGAVSWISDPYDSRVCIPRFLFHCLYWVEELIQAFLATKDPAYLQRAKELSERWISECLYSERWPHIWDDHITALRAIILCRLWVECRERESWRSKFMSDLLAAIFRHGEKLSRDSFYRQDHDHGVTQAYALLAIALLFPDEPYSAHWVKLAMERLESQMAEHVSIEGIHREHSPFYHFFVFRQFSAALSLGQAYDLSFSSSFCERLQLMLISGAYLLKPDGTLPAFGDTANSDPLLVEEPELSSLSKESVAEFLWSKTQTHQGRMPQRASRLFPAAGYAVMRSGWGEDEPFTDERYFIMRLATFKTAHYHQDLFSFELYAFGEDLLIDSGGPFSYGSSTRNYFLSARSHNTVVIGDMQQRVGEPEILCWQTDDVFDVLDVEFEIYLGVIHRRLVIFIRPHCFILIDRLRSQHENVFSQFFHMNPKLVVAHENLQVSTRSRDGGATVQIIPLIREGLELSVHCGNSSPRQGWVCSGDEQMQPNCVVEYLRGGREVEFATVIVPERPALAPAVCATMTGRLFHEEAQLDVTIGSRTDRIKLNKDGACQRV